MADDPDARQIALGYLESLRAAGVDWIPKASPARLSAPALLESATSPEEPVPKPGLARHEELFSAPAGSLAASGLSLEERCSKLKLLAEKVRVCTRCAELCSTRTQTVFGVGKIMPELCFVGEAPGADEDAQGEPFVGPAGQLLNKIIVACGFKREEVYICNILKCRPPGNRLPLANEAANCREYLEEQLELIQPRFICALGACAAQNLLHSTMAIGKLRGSFHRYKGIPVWCTYHPAYLLRSPDKKRDVWDDMKRLLGEMGRQVPKTSGPA
jgi:uracil-DNA glycosylase